MKFKINRDHFTSGLQQVINVVGTKISMPILNNVLIEAEEDSIGLTTTNLDLGIRCRIAAEVTESGGITLPVRKLATIIREYPTSMSRLSLRRDIRRRSRRGVRNSA